MLTRLLLLVPVTGCYLSFRVEGDARGFDAVSADGAGDPEDAAADDGLPGEADAAVGSCPPAIPATGPERLGRRWTARIADAWPANGSAGLGIHEDAVIVVVPRPAPEESWVCLLDRETGETLRRPGEVTVGEWAGATAVAAVPGSDGVLVLGALPAGGSATGAVDWVRLRSGGETSDRWHCPIDFEGVRVLDMRSAGGERAVSVATSGSVGRDAWALQATGMLRGSGAYGPWRLHSEMMPGRTSAAFVAALGDVFAWTSPEGVATRRLDGTPITTMDVAAPARFTPVAAAPDVSSSAHFLLARRSEPLVPENPVFVECRSAFDLSPIETYPLEELESLVDRPEPREFAGGDRTPALAWVAHDPSADEPACLYVTPLGLYGGPSGASLRIDAEDDAPSTTPPQFVRMISEGSALFVAWRCALDLCVVGLDRSW